MLDIFRLRHRRLQGLLSAYVDGRLTGAQAERLERHLERCETCRSDLESLRATVDLLRSLPELAVPRSFRLTEIPEPSPAPFVMPRTLMAAASAAAVLLVSLLAVDLAGVGTPGQADLAATQVAVARAVAEAPTSEEADAGTDAETIEAFIEVAAEKEVIVEVQAEKIVEVERVVEVEKSVEVETEKILVATPTPSLEALAVAEPDEAAAGVTELAAAPESFDVLSEAAEDTAQPGEPTQEPLVLEAAGTEAITSESQAQALVPVAPTDERPDETAEERADGEIDSPTTVEAGSGFPYLQLEIAAGAVLALLLGGLGGLLVLYRRRAGR